MLLGNEQEEIKSSSEEPPCCCWKRTLKQPLYKTVLQFLKKKIIHIWTSSPTFGCISRKEENFNLKRYWYMQSSVHSGSIYNSQTWKQPKCSSTMIGLRRRGVYIQWNNTQLQKKWILPFAAIQMNLENIMLSEVSQTKTNTINIHCHSHVESKK